MIHTKIRLIETEHQKQHSAWLHSMTKRKAAGVQRKGTHDPACPARTMRPLRASWGVVETTARSVVPQNGNVYPPSISCTRQFSRASGESITASFARTADGPTTSLFLSFLTGLSLTHKNGKSSVMTRNPAGVWGDMSKKLSLRSVAPVLFVSIHATTGLGI